ncbi:MAG TPA: hypothetical protein VGI73_11980 [Solirubrobacterales bacterium]
MALAAALAAAVGAAEAKADSPVLEIVAPALPVSFTAEGGAVTAAMTDFDTVVHCTGSHGEGAIVGPRAAISNYFFTGCTTQGGTAGGAKCKSESANAEEIRTGAIEAELVFISQARDEVGMLLNPHGGVYMDFECGSEDVKAIGSFLSPVGPLNQRTSSFSATLARSGTLQIPSEYENAFGDRLKALPTGEREGQPAAATGVELAFAIHPSMPLEVKALTGAEVEARRHDQEAAAKKREDEEAAARKRLEEELAAQRSLLARERKLSKALARCQKVASKGKRAKCVHRAKRRYGIHLQI